MKFEIHSTPLEILTLKKGMAAEQAGAFCAFEGWVRNHNNGRQVVSLEYEALKSLCEKEAEKIFFEVRTKFSTIDVQCAHRAGRLSIGDMAVWVGVTAAHRDSAFEACRYVIDEVKARLPIWKKEFYADGDSGWVNCQNSVQVQDIELVHENDFYSRQVLLPQIGQDGQRKLKDARVLVVGAGGLGSTALLSLASAGIGTIGICEGDLLETSNLHRQPLYSFQNIGQKKIDLAFERLTELNPFIRINQHPEKITPHNVKAIIEGYDFILDCTDNFSAKFLLNDAAFFFRKTLIQSSIYQWEGQLQVLTPDSRGCLRCLWPQVPEADCVGACADVGVLGVVASVFGHLQALEAIKIILQLPDRLSNEIFILNLQNLSQRKIKSVQNPRCPLCGHEPHIQAIDPLNYEKTKGHSFELDKLKTEELNAFCFIDIREWDEVLKEPISEIECLHVPYSEYNRHPFSFSPEICYVIVCAKDVRSRSLTKKLHEQGVTNVFYLKDGVKAIKNHGSTRVACSPLQRGRTTPSEQSESRGYHQE